MSESAHEAARDAEAKRADRERHEKIVNGVMDALRSVGFLRPGETLKSWLPDENVSETWVARCETTILGDKESVAERSKQFGTGDPLSNALEKAGYRVVVDYDQEKSDGTFDCLLYSLYEKDK